METHRKRTTSRMGSDPNTPRPRTIHKYNKTDRPQDNDNYDMSRKSFNANNYTYNIFPARRIFSTRKEKTLAPSRKYNTANTEKPHGNMVHRFEWGY